jgi:hypothetical protein
MSILSDFEDRVAGAVEGLFAGAFRSPVQPVELAKALAKAMDDGRAIGVGKVYAPVTYTIALSREDKRNLGRFTATLEGELATYLVDHAREAGYALPSRPKVHFDVHNDLKLGRFRVSADLAPAEEEEAVVVPAAPSVESPSTPAPAAPAPPRPAPPQVAQTQVAMPAVPGPSAEPQGGATISFGDHDVLLRAPRMVLGRLHDCDVCIPDKNVSRQHAALVGSADGWGIEDLGSTNGTFVNGEKVSRAPLREGDVIEIGTTRIVYHAPRS